MQVQVEFKLDWLWYISPPTTGNVSEHPPVSTSVTIWSFSSFSVIFDNHSALWREASGPSVSLHSPLQLTDLTLESNSHVGALNSTKTLVMCSGAHLGIRATPQFSPTLMNYTCLASHLPRSSLCNVSHAWRRVCVFVCLCGCIYIQTGIEGMVTHSLCSLFLPHNLPTHPPPFF